MRAPTGTSSGGPFPLTLVPADVSTAPLPAKAATSASFEDILQQEGGSFFDAPDSKGKMPFEAETASDQQAATPAPAATSNEKIQPPTLSVSALVASLASESPALSSDISTNSEEPSSSAGTAAKSTSTALPTLSDLTAMIAQALTGASNTQSTPVIKSPSTSPSTPDASGTSEPETDSSSETTTPQIPFQLIFGGADLTGTTAHALPVAANAQQTWLSKAFSDPAAKSGTTASADSSSATTTAQSPFQYISSRLGLSITTAQTLPLTSNTQQPSPSKAFSDPTAKSKTEAVDDSSSATTTAQSSFQPMSGASDMSAMIVQASILSSNAQQSSAAKVPAPSSAKNAAALGTTLPATSAQASILVANARQNLRLGTSSSAAATASSALEEELPLSASNNGLPEGPIKEKKSASTSAEGSFIQSGSSAFSTGATSLCLSGTPLPDSDQSTAAQQLTTNVESHNSSIGGVFATTSSSAGTANVENDKAMNTSLSFPELFSSCATSTLSQQSPADLQILLSSNHDFEDALKQVMHVAQLTQTNESRTPMRVEIEIQTPPGAIVNVYVSRQNDQWRAQLSTNDLQALNWVQDKMSSLRQSNEFGVEVRWLPPQMDGSSSHNANLSWDRSGQGQSSSYQQPDERQQSQRQKKAPVLPDIGSILSNQFSNKVHALGRAS